MNNGRLWSSLIGALIGALITGFATMATFGRQLTRVETKVDSIDKSVSKVDKNLRDHELWHRDHP